MTNDLIIHMEAILYTCEEAISKEELGQQLGISAEQCERTLEELRQHLIGHSVCIVGTPSHVELRLTQQASAYVENKKDEEDNMLTPAASETLAIIAYRGPISRYDVDSIRGVDSRRIIRNLIHQGLIRRVTTTTKTAKYDITENFLAHLGITSRTKLPQYDTLSNNERIQEILNAKYVP